MNCIQIEILKPILKLKKKKKKKTSRYTFYHSCETGWSRHGKRCFKVFNDPKSWKDAENICQDFDGHLASIHSDEEYVFIQNLIRYTTHEPTRAWIGGHDAVHEGAWLWSDGSKFNYQIWFSGEPNDDGNEDCLEMNFAKKKGKKNK
uniref:C-type lectin domain-containing protein n=1 Tax=Cyprinus carpio TaxID=7962 RepID=A0A8C1VTT5_CYPCA